MGDIGNDQMHVAWVGKNHRPLQKPTQRNLGGLTRRNGAIW